MSLYQKFATDTDLETGSGVTLDYGEDGKFVLHRAGGSNRKYQKLFNERFKPYRQMMQADNLEPNKFREILAGIYADSVVIGWDGVKDAKGKNMPYSRETVIKLFTDLPDFFEKIITEAGDIANFRKAEIEADAKNSVKS